MRAAFSLLALVIVAAIVLSLARKQATALKPQASGAASAPALALPQPEALREQVQSAVDAAARNTAEAASAATN